MPALETLIYLLVAVHVLLVQFDLATLRGGIRYSHAHLLEQLCDLIIQFSFSILGSDKHYVLGAHTCSEDMGRREGPLPWKDGEGLLPRL